jgi:hypothetical protein
MGKVINSDKYSSLLHYGIYGMTVKSFVVQAKARKPKSFLGLIYNSKIGRFATITFKVLS